MTSKIVGHRNLPSKPSFAESIASAGLTVGQLKSATITRVVEGLGLFVRPDGVDYDALVHKNSIGPRPITNPDAIGYTPGLRVKVRITEIKSEDGGRIQAALVDPKATLFALRPEIKEMDRLSAIVDTVEEDRLFVTARGGIRMFVPYTETGVVMSRGDRGPTLSDHFATGDGLEVVVLKVDAQKGHALASIRHALDDTKPTNTTTVSGTAPLTASLGDIQATRVQRKKSRKS